MDKVAMFGHTGQTNRKGIIMDKHDNQDNVDVPVISAEEAELLKLDELRKERGWPELLKPAEVAAIFRVSPKTATRWANDPNAPISAIRTIGGHRRFRAIDVIRAIEAQ